MRLKDILYNLNKFDPEMDVKKISYDELSDPDTIHVDMLVFPPRPAMWIDCKMTLTSDGCIFE